MLWPPRAQLDPVEHAAAACCGVRGIGAMASRHTLLLLVAQMQDLYRPHPVYVES